jgi:DNA-binding transcriptional regulator YhcF (GntR family)
MDEAQLVIRIHKTFEESHNFGSVDYLASRIGATSEDIEKILRNLEREGRVKYDATTEIWRWIK